MSTDRWKRTEGLFLLACALSHEKRKRFLDDACGEERALREEVESLLRSNHGAWNHLEEMVFHVGFHADPIPDGRLPGILVFLELIGSTSPRKSYQDYNPARCSTP